MRYKPFTIDKNTLKQIYELGDHEVDDVFNTALGVNLLNKTLNEVTSEEIREFVSYQKSLQVVNQLLGIIPIQPEDLDIEAMILETLRQNEKQNTIPYKFTTNIKKQDAIPIKNIICSPQIRKFRRAVLHYICDKKIVVTEEQLCKLFENESTKEISHRIA